MLVLATLSQGLAVQPCLNVFKSKPGLRLPHKNAMSTVCVGGVYVLCKRQDTAGQ